MINELWNLPSPLLSRREVEVLLQTIPRGDLDEVVLNRGMNRNEYLAFHKEITARMYEITCKKNADYTGATGDDPFSNFSRVESLGVCSTEQGFLVRLLDKFMRISSFVQKGFLNVKDESVEDTLMDMANYAILFMAYLHSKKPKHS